MKLAVAAAAGFSLSLFLPIHAYAYAMKIAVLCCSLSLLPTVTHANEEYLCAIGPDGEEDCQEVYFEPDIYDNPPGDNDEQYDDDESWRAALAIEGCTDHDADCETLAESGECENNPNFM